MACTSHLQLMSPLARGRGTSRQSTNHPALMALAVTTVWCFIVVMDRVELHWPLAAFTLSELQFRPLSKLEKGAAKLQFLPPPIRTPPRVSTMPRLRGKSRRGAAWYRAESRRKRIQNFERALALASTRRKRRPWSPPMAIVEEISLEEAMQSHPPIARAEDSKPPPGATLGNPSAASTEDLFPPCIVEEEAPPDDTTGMAEPAGLPTRPAGDSSTRAARDFSTRASDDSGGMDQPSFSELWHLPLIFELRGLMDDLAFRLARMDQRLDMLFAAHSKNLPKRQCPTCAQAYSLPAGWRQKRQERTSTSK
jgi:hypothetical protein